MVFLYLKKRDSCAAFSAATGVHHFFFLFMDLSLPLLYEDKKKGFPLNKP